MTDTSKLKTELGNIRSAIESGSFDRDGALKALDAAEKALDEKEPLGAQGKIGEPPQPSAAKPAAPTPSAAG